MSPPDLAWLDDEVLILGGDAMRWFPRGRQWWGRTVYLVSGSMHAVARQYLQAQDEVAGPVAGAISSIRVGCGGGKYWTLRGGDAWGLPSGPSEAAQCLAELRQAAADEGIGWAPTASSLSGHVGRKVLPWLGATGTRLGDRWESLWRDAVHPGPMLALAGGAEDATQLDMNAAYLSAMEHVVIPAQPFHCGPLSLARWNAVAESDAGGVVVAIVEVDRSMFVGPMPARTHGVVTWPVGRFVGTWTVDWLRRWQDGGVSVAAVVDSALTDGGTSIAPLYERFSAVAHKPLRKLLYQRWWARWNTRGWWTGALPHDAKHGQGFSSEAYTRKGEVAAGVRELSWSEPGLVPRERRRPDVSCLIAGAAARGLVGMLQRYGRDACLAHVDAIWVRGRHAAPYGWTAKSAGPLRVYGIGCYEHGGRVAAQGAPSWLAGEELTAWVRSRGGSGLGTALSRQWPYGLPRESAEASSEAQILDMPSQVVHPVTPTWSPTSGSMIVFRDGGAVAWGDGEPRPIADDDLPI